MTSYQQAAAAMRTFVVLLALHAVFASVDETDKDCGDDETCLEQEDCPSFLEKYERYKRLPRGSEKSNLETRLKEAVCNKREKAVCCPKCGAVDECIARNECKYADERIEQRKRFQSRGQSVKANEILQELKSRICNKKQRFLCCPPETSKPNYLPRLDSCGLSTTPPSRVVGGENTRPGDFPFAALLGYEVERRTGTIQGRPGNSYNETKWSCSGTLINRWYVLTAAHCQGKTPATKISKLRLGEWEVAGFGGGKRNRPTNPNGEEVPKEQDFDITADDITVHEDFQIVYENSRKNVVNDIALIKLPRPATINDGVQIACLPFITQEFQTYLNIADVVSGIVGRSTTVVGWGKTDADQLASWNGVGSRIQQKLELPVLSKEQCKETNTKFVPRNSQICAGGEIGRDSCRGDSGGGLFIQKNETEKNTAWYLVGIVSFGSRDCGNGAAGVYTRVSSFIPWIKKNLK